MPWTIVLAALALGGLVLVMLPLFRPARPWDTEERTDLDLLLDSKARVLRSIKDVDHEKEAGLLSEEDWRETREEYVTEAVRLNREVAARTGVDPSAPESGK